MAVAGFTSTRPARGRSLIVRAACGLAFGGVLAFAFVRLVNVSSVLHRLAHLSVLPAVLCGVAFLAAYGVRALRWRTLLPAPRPSVKRVVAIYQVATFLNWMLPIRGGEIAKCLLLRRSDGVAVSRTLATVGVDKTMDLLPAVVLLAVLPFVRLRLGPALWVLLLMALGGVVIGAGLVAVTARRREHVVRLLARMSRAVLPRRSHAMIWPFIERFLDTLVGLFRHPRLLCIAGVYTAGAVALDSAFCLLAFRAVGVHAALPVILYGYTFYNLAFILPTPPGQVGSNELVGLLIFSGIFRLGRSGVAAMFVFSHPWTAVLMTASGLLCLSALGLSLRGSLNLARSRGELTAP
jgi:uncharacterized protein (TIRG00374 family)